MILVLLGTQNNDFHRLLEEVENNIKNGTIKEEVIVQAGYTKFKSYKMRILDFISKEEIERLQDEADLIITHGGVGSILNSVKKDKKVIAIPRLHEYGEHVNNHQLDIVKYFDEQGYIIGINDVKDLKSAIDKSINFKPKKYIVGNDKMLKMISDFIEEN